MRLVLVTKEDLGEWFEKARPFVRQIAQDSRNRHTEQTLYKEIEAGVYWLAVAEQDGECRAALIAASGTFGTGLRELLIIGLTGRSMKDWLHLERELSIVATNTGHHVIRAYARPGWSRVMKGYATTHVILEKWL